MFPSDYYERTLESESPKTLSEDLLSQRPRQGRTIKILTLKQLLQRLPILLAQVKAGNTYEKRKSS